MENVMLVQWVVTNFFSFLSHTPQTSTSPALRQLWGGTVLFCALCWGTFKLWCNDVTGPISQWLSAVRADDWHCRPNPGKDVILLTDFGKSLRYQQALPVAPSYWSDWLKLACDRQWRTDGSSNHLPRHFSKCLHFSWQFLAELFQMVLCNKPSGTSDNVSLPPGGQNHQSSLP